MEFRKPASPKYIPFSEYFATNGEGASTTNVVRKKEIKVVYSPNNSIQESHETPHSLKRAMFTVTMSTTQILIANFAACKLLNFNSDQLRSMRLQNLVEERHRHKIKKLRDNLLNDSEEADRKIEKLVEFVTKDGEVIPAAIFFKRIEPPQRCLAIAHPLERKISLLTVDTEGLIGTCDDEATKIFEYDLTELIGLHLTDVIPGAFLYRNKRIAYDISFKQRLTGKTKNGSYFPLYLLVKSNPAVPGSWHIAIWVFLNLTGLVILNRDLRISHCSYQFMKLLFGANRKRVLNEKITQFIPDFPEEIDPLSRRISDEPDHSEPSYESGSTSPKKLFIKAQKEVEDELRKQDSRSCNDVYHISTCHHKSCKDKSFGDYRHSFKKCTLPAASNLSLRLWKSENDVPSAAEWDYRFEKAVSGKSGNRDKKRHKKGEGDSASKKKNRDRYSDCKNLGVKDGYYAGLGKHRDGNEINIYYKVKAIPAGNKLFYGVWISRDAWSINVCPNMPESVIDCPDFLHIPTDDDDDDDDTDNDDTDNDDDDNDDTDNNDADDDDDDDDKDHDDDDDDDKDHDDDDDDDREDDDDDDDDDDNDDTDNNDDATTTADTSFIEALPELSALSVMSQHDELLTQGEYSNNYTNIQQIGKGAFGYVKMAFRHSDGLLVVTKFIKKRKINVQSWVYDPKLNMKIPMEISLLATLKHPNIVEVLDVFYNDSFFQLVMKKHGAGMDLFEFIERKPNSDEPLNSYIFRQIVSAVSYLDRIGVLHRDIKDENVIINERFQIKLIDFGSATFKSPDKMFSVFYGTVEYCSPEVLQGNKYRGPELEIWALGVTLYVLSFGENPFSDIQETIKGRFSVSRSTSPPLLDLLQKMLNKDVEDRITILRVADHPWTLQPVDLDKYKFEEVVNCSTAEADPPRFIREFIMEKKRAAQQNVDPDGDRTMTSTNSIGSPQTTENTETLEQYDENIQDFGGDTLSDESMMKSSTPVSFSSSTSRDDVTKPAASPNTACDRCHCKDKNKKRFSLDLNILKKITSGKSKYSDSTLSTQPLSARKHAAPRFDKSEMGLVHNLSEMNLAPRRKARKSRFFGAVTRSRSGDRQKYMGDFRDRSSSHEKIERTIRTKFVPTKAEIGGTSTSDRRSVEGQDPESSQNAEAKKEENK